MLVLISFFIYFYSLFTSGIEGVKKPGCVTLEKWFNITKLLAMFDILLSIILPFFVIAITNILIVFKLMKFKNPFRKSLKKRGLRVSNNLSVTNDSIIKIRKMQQSSPNVLFKSCSNLKGSNVTSMIQSSTKEQRKAVYSRTTRMLIIISTTFLILHGPIVYCKTIYFLKAVSDGILERSDSSIRSNSNDLKEIDTIPLEEIIERLTCYVYYLNFSLNFFLYVLNGSKFRNILWKKMTLRK